MPYSLEKEYYKFEELAQKLTVTPEDIEYIILTKEVPVYVFLSNAVLEKGEYQITDGGRILHKPRDVFEFTGLKQLRREDFDMVLRHGSYDIHDFMPDKKCHYTRLTNYKAAMRARGNDLVIKTLDLQSLNVTKDIQLMSKARQSAKKFTFENDFRMVKLGDEIFHFGDVQAAVLKILYEARRDENAWKHAKTLLHMAGSSSLRMSDVFKSQKDWKKLIEGNGRGYYRLNPDVFSDVIGEMAA